MGTCLHLCSHTYIISAMQLISFHLFPQSSLGFAAVVVGVAKPLHQIAFLRHFSPRLNWKYEEDQVSTECVRACVCVCVAKWRFLILCETLLWTDRCFTYTGWGTELPGWDFALKSFQQDFDVKIITITLKHKGQEKCLERKTTTEH